MSVEEAAPDATDRRDHDRSFRPDVEGLRAVAVAVVVFYHAGVHGFGGGYVGVDVFFVISGFVITKLLLRQIGRNGRPRFAEFYGRRARRILPAAGLVALCAILASYRWLGFIQGNETSRDARWVAVFLANNHFASEGTNYLQSQLPPSPLQNYWSLAVEEQFYVVYPAALFAVCLLARQVSARAKVAAFTVIVFVVSLLWSVHDTTSNGTQAYFSITTRAWELALGGFVAATTVTWGRLAPVVASAVAWVGAAAVAVATAGFSASTSYPGWRAALPVVGAALIIVGGVSAGRTGPEVVLGTAPLRWIGKLSFSIYLWHWPILTIATEDAAHGLNEAHRLLLVALSVGAAALTYALVENPIRHSKWLARSPVRSIALGLAVIVAILAVATYQLHTHSGL